MTLYNDMIPLLVFLYMLILNALVSKDQNAGLGIQMSRMLQIALRELRPFLQELLQDPRQEDALKTSGNATLNGSKPLKT